jgi:hypothetical protein
VWERLEDSPAAMGGAGCYLHRGHYRRIGSVASAIRSNRPPVEEKGRSSMLDLPILKTEAHVLARRWSAYQARAAFGLTLLAFFWCFYRSDTSWASGRISSRRELAEFGAAAFEWFGVGQALVLMVLVPAATAGTIAEARARQTLPALLTSPLSGGEIIIDLLGAKMLRVGIVLAVGLPVGALLGLLGGVDPRSVVFAYAGTLSTIFCLAALSLLVSVYSRRPGPAVLRVYGLEALWLVCPWIVGTLALTRWAWLRPLVSLNQWIEPTSPLSLVGPGTFSAWSTAGPIQQFLTQFPMPWTWRGPAVLTTPVVRMVGLQVAYGLAFLAVAAWRLRPVARRFADSPRARMLFGRVRSRRRPLPACGEKPMMWKECLVGVDRPARFGLWVALVVFGCMTVFYSQPFAYRYPLALDEFFQYGYSTGPRGNNGFMRSIFFGQFAGFSVMFYVVALVAIVVESATGISRERESGTWDGLLTTALEPAEIIRAKVIGAIYRQRALVYLVFGPWLVGLVLWALHPLGLLLAATGLAAFLWFAAALGTSFSLRSKSSVEALVKTLVILLALNVGTLVAGTLLTGSTQAAGLLGNTLVLLSFLPISTHELSGNFIHPIHIWREFLFVGVLTSYVALYAALAWNRSRFATCAFDAAAGRPRVARPPRGSSPTARFAGLRSSKRDRSGGLETSPVGSCTVDRG